MAALPVPRQSLLNVSSPQVYFDPFIGPPLNIPNRTPLASCQHAVVNFNGGVAPYVLRIIDALNDTTPLLHTYQNLTSSPYDLIVEEKPDTTVYFNITDAFGATTLSTGHYTVQASNDTSCLTKGNVAPTEPNNIFLGSIKAQTIFIVVWVCFGALLFIFATWWCIRSRLISKRGASDAEMMDSRLLANTEETGIRASSPDTVQGVGGFAYYCRSLLSRGSSTARRSMLQTPDPPPGSPPTTIYSMPPPDYDSLSPITPAPPVSATNGLNEIYSHSTPRDMEKR